MVGIQINQIPEANSMFLTPLGLPGLLGWGQRRRRTKD